jgi:hypothetical protein
MITWCDTSADFYVKLLPQVHPALRPQEDELLIASTDEITSNLQRDVTLSFIAASHTRRLGWSLYHPRVTLLMPSKIRFIFPEMIWYFLIHIILPVALLPWGLIQSLIEMSTRNLRPADKLRLSVICLKNVGFSTSQKPYRSPRPVPNYLNCELRRFRDQSHCTHRKIKINTCQYFKMLYLILCSWCSKFIFNCLPSTIQQYQDLNSCLFIVTASVV